MQESSKKKYRRLSRNFKGKIELMKRIPLEKLEANFLEIHELHLQEYIKREMNRFPKKSRKDIILKMYKINIAQRCYSDNFFRNTQTKIF